MLKPHVSIQNTEKVDRLLSYFAQNEHILDFGAGCSNSGSRLKINSDVQNKYLTKSSHNGPGCAY